MANPTLIADKLDLANRLLCKATVRSVNKVLNKDGDSEQYRLNVTLEGHRVQIFPVVPGIISSRQPEELSLSYPFSEIDWKHTVRLANSVGKKAWRDTHGCEGCTTRTDRYDYRRVNSACKHCDGEGTVL